MSVELYPYQQDAVERMHNGCILCGGVGSGKSRTSLAYFVKARPNYICDLYIITTARKRDTFEWKADMLPFKSDISTEQVTIDSWNNIKKYENVHHAFFIFDEQRLVGSGTWVKAFLKIAKSNQWILLSATPGDKWEDYIPVFIANGFYKNRTEFIRDHIVYSAFSKFPKVDRYLNTGRLIRLRNRILINMDFQRQTTAHHINEPVGYDILKYKAVVRDRWNAYEEKPIETASEFCYILRKVVNCDKSRAETVKRIAIERMRVIVFYNFDYELDILKNIDYGKEFEVAEWNGHKHQPVPETDRWVYLVQYTAGSEGWNCIRTDSLIFYSLNYSYKSMIQAAGRIDRLNTPYQDLYYYHLYSHSSIDTAIRKALNNKKDFNQMRFWKGE